MKLRQAGRVALGAAAALTVIATTSPASAADPTPHLTVRNGTSECWTHGATLWHFVVFNDGTAGGKYTVTFRRSDGDPDEVYSRHVPKGQGVNDGIVIPAGTTVAYVRVSSPEQATLFLRYDVPNKARCSH